MDCPENLESELKELRDTFNSGITKQESWRRSQLKALLSLLEEKEDDIAKALEQDLGKHPVESFRDEVGPLIKSVNYALKGLKRWMSSKKVISLSIDFNLACLFKVDRRFHKEYNAISTVVVTLVG
ncbi:aldehyde dehydrogenase family 3 member F1-like [Olea europaea subsp. europaea]|uniref:Aldehyde dehydrogenase family 3 member F1-like n=1 Tax=Olea europaea subsp. europaea TaxID=158383 RepID=A0A8S0S7U0_OLEEU|nr:aldehyde dehydrogenase family 3 member F1-like [Olea europaea subsp. europaea]